MSRTTAVILFVSLFILPSLMKGFQLHAQGNDPTLAGMILLYTEKAKSELKQQEEMMLMVSTGHVWITEEVNATTDLQKQFNDYLDSFHSIIMYAAQIYGFYHEIDRMAEMYQMEADKLKDLMGDYEKEQITEDLKIQKAVDFVVDNAKESKPRSTKKKEEE